MLQEFKVLGLNMREVKNGNYEIDPHFECLQQLFIAILEDGKYVVSIKASYQKKFDSCFLHIIINIDKNKPEGGLII